MIRTPLAHSALADVLRDRRDWLRRGTRVCPRAQTQSGRSGDAQPIRADVSEGRPDRRRVAARSARLRARASWLGPSTVVSLAYLSRRRFGAKPGPTSIVPRSSARPAARIPIAHGTTDALCRRDPAMGRCREGDPMSRTFQPQADLKLQGVDRQIWIRLADRPWPDFTLRR